MARSITAKLIEGPHELHKEDALELPSTTRANPPAIRFMSVGGVAPCRISQSVREQPRLRPWNSVCKTGVEARQQWPMNYSLQLGATDPLDWTRSSPPQLPRCMDHSARQ